MSVIHQHRWQSQTTNEKKKINMDIGAAEDDGGSDGGVVASASASMN